MKQHLWWILSLLGVVIIVIAVLSSGAATPSMELDADEHIKGNPNASAVLIEYSDFQCPGCAGVYPIIDQLAKDTNVKVVYRHYPLVQIHPHATLAAQAAEAAALQGKFWDMHDVLFNTQSEWAVQEDPRAFFASLAESIGLDTTTFQTDLESEEVREAVAVDLGRAQKLRLPGTPSLILNGQQLQNVNSYDALKAAVEAAQ